MRNAGFKSMRYSTDRTFADKAKPVYICRNCETWHDPIWHDRAKRMGEPHFCKQCGRVGDFEYFQSSGEAKWWVRLLRRQEDGLIRELERQYRIPLIACHKDTGKPVAFGDYYADFRFYDVANGKRVIAECKPGAELTYESRIKIGCAIAMGYEIEFLT